MRRIAMMMVGMLAAGCGGAEQAVGNAASSGTSPFPPTPQENVALAGRTLPTPQAGVAFLTGEGWLSSRRNDYNLGTDAGSRLMVFARSAANFKDSRIWFSQREGQGWSEPVEVPFSDPRYKDSDPWLTPDGGTLYFVSNRPVAGDAPNSSLDIWRVPIDAGRFGPPEHLAAVASDGEELGPELHDGWLYFNSSRKGGPAKLSIYQARVDGGGFDTPVPMPAPFNDGDIQGDFTLSPDSRVAVFWSRRDGSDELDLFAACRRPTAWSRAVRLPAPINAAGMDFTPAFSADGSALYFASLRTGEGATGAGSESGARGAAGAPGAVHRTGPAGADSVLNGQSNLYTAPSTLVEAAMRAGECHV